MHFSHAILALVATLVMDTHAIAISRRDVDPSLVPDFGITPGTNPDGNGSCEGVNGALIPCDCPPDRATFITALNGFVNAGNAFGTPVSFPTGNDDVSVATRRSALIVTLQDVKGGAGLGCPAASATF